jgi:hypothetical protein
MSMSQVLRLKPAFNDEQAQALAGLFDEETASKRDLIDLKSDVEKFKIEIKAEVEKLGLEVQRDLKATEARLVTWVVGQGAATIGILFALLHFFGK